MSAPPEWPKYGSLNPSKAVRRRAEIVVGSVVFTHDINHRVYLEKNSGPSPRHFFVPREVVGETSRSWLVGWVHNPDKIPKSSASNLYGLDDVEDALWVKNHARSLGYHVQSLNDAALLRSIAKLAGFEP